jgi:hypothetical protein
VVAAKVKSSVPGRYTPLSEKSTILAERNLIMTNERSNGVYLLVLGSAMFVLLGTALAFNSPLGLMDFKELYYGARCLVQHHDPYNDSQMLDVFRAAGGTFPSDPGAFHKVVSTVSVCTNLPTALFFIIPLSLLPCGPAGAIWLVLTAASFILASFLMWNIAVEYAPTISSFLIFLVIANSPLLLFVGNAAGIVVSFCVIAVWCFVRERFVPLGILCLALSLLIKPHDAGLIWLFFLLAGGIRRKRALQALALTAALSVPAILWVSHVAPHWPHELHSNLLASTARGGRDDPGPASSGGHGLGMVINLQSAISLARDDPRFYNPVTYLVCGVLLLTWLLMTLRSRSSPTSTWFALAAIAALSMLPIYHRSYDAKLLLLAVPACAVLWAESRMIGSCALIVSALAILSTGDLFWAGFFGLASGFHLAPTGQSGYIWAATQVLPAPICLLAAGLFYLWVYARRASDPASPAKCESTGEKRRAQDAISH